MFIFAPNKEVNRALRLIKTMIMKINTMYLREMRIVSALFKAAERNPFVMGALSTLYVVFTFIFWLYN